MTPEEESTTIVNTLRRAAECGLYALSRAHISDGAIQLLKEQGVEVIRKFQPLGGRRGFNYFEIQFAKDANHTQ
jgi:hypothetical protein